MAFSQQYINDTIGKIQIIHARFADEFCDVLKYRLGRDVNYNDLNDVNINVGWIIDILYDYVPYGDSELNDQKNGLSEASLQSLINYAYRMLNKFGAKIFVPNEPNIYM